MTFPHLIVPVLWLLSAAARPLQVPPPAADPEQEIVVHGYPPHCHPRLGDPQDEVDLTAAASHPRQQVIRTDPATGKFGLFPDDYPEIDLRTWQRDGTRLDQYVFRMPADDTPVCIGARTRSAPGFAQLRRAFLAKAYWGKVMRFTAFVATRKAANVRFWVAGGAGGYQPGRQVKPGSNIVVGGPQWPPITGDHEWTPVSFTVGPIPCMATQISYGVTLQGGGDVWVYKPKFEEVPDDELSPAVRARLRGATYLQKDPICRHFLRGEKLYRVADRNRNEDATTEIRYDTATEIKDDNEIVPGVAILVKGGMRIGGDMQPVDTFAVVPYEKYFAKGLNN